MAIEAFAPAKVNLALHVTGRRADGYHLLDSLVVFADVGDRLTLADASDLSLTVTGPFAPGVPVDGSNLVLKSAALIAAGRGARIVLEKHLPHGGGIGGGSSDAAAALKALARIWGVPLPKANDVLRLGADVPVCLGAPAPHRIQGIGELLAPAPALPDAHLVLVNPGVAVPTAEVFGRLAAGAGAGNPGLAAFPGVLDFERFAGWLAAQRNDLEVPARAIAPAIETAASALRTQPDCRLARMTGSGSTVFGLFATAGQARAAATRIAVAEPRWWVRAATMLKPSR